MIVGITGCPGAGKSVLSGAVAQQGWELVDADLMGREVVDSDADVLENLVGAFGNDVVGPDGTLIRSLVAERAFADRQSTDILNGIVHPALIRRLKSRIGSIRASGGNGVVDCSLIFEWGVEGDHDLVVCVHADPGIRKARIMKRDGRSDAEVEGMFRAQLPEDEKMRRAHLAIANNGTAEKMIIYGKMIAALPELFAGDIEL